MTYLMEFFVFCLVVALAGVASNPSPYYGASGLVVCAGMGCGILTLFGSSFVSLILLLIYLGGMLVVFAYSVALASDPFPESWGDWFVGVYFGVYVLLVVLLGLVYGGFQGVEFGVSGADSWGLSVVRVDLSGVSLLYHFGGEILLISGWALLLTLFVVLELTRGLARGGIRVV